MQKMVWIFAAFIFAEGIIFLLKPALYKKIAGFFAKGKMPFLAALLKIVFGVLFLIAATSCRFPVIAVVIGLISAAAGILIFAIGAEKSKKMIQWFASRPQWQARALAIIAIIFAGLLIYTAGLKPV